MCELTVIGQAFLWHQIRCIVAVLFLVGQERESPQVSRRITSSLHEHKLYKSDQIGITQKGP